MSRPLRIDDLADLVVPGQPALSPDGSRLAYVVRTHDLDEDRAATALWIVDGDDEPRPLTHGAADGSPAWSPDGATLAFVRDGQVWLLPAAGGEPARLTDLPLGAGEPRWSPDGTRIAFSAPVDAAASDGEDDAARARRAAAPVVAGGLDYQADGMGLLRTVRLQVHVVDVAGGGVRRLTSGRQHALDPSWSPDGGTLAYLAKRADTSDLVAESAVHLVDASGAGDPRVVAFAGGYAASARFAPDGRSLVVAGHRGEPRGHVRLHVVDLETGAVTERAGELDRNVMVGEPAYPGATPVVAPDGETILFCVRDRGCTHLYAVPLAGGPATPLIADDDTVVSGVSLAGDTVAVALTTATSFGEIVTLDRGTGARRVRTRHGAALGRLHQRVARQFTIGDGTVVEGWVMRAEGTTGPSPLLVDIHGGPHNAWNAAADEMHLYHQELVTRGWTVLLVNPRGSDGYGEKHYDGVFGGWGTADAADFLEPVDALVAEGVADPARLAVTGYSYGGFMTGYLTSRDDRFAAAVPGGMISDLRSAGTSDLSSILDVVELGVRAWEDTADLAAMSPITRVGDVTTPTLVLHGAEDRRCPVGQAQQWYHALRELGVETELVLYPDASHLFPLAGRPSHRLDYGRRVVDWVERYAGLAVERPRATSDTPNHTASMGGTR